MPSPRCTSHMTSVNEYRPFVLHCRAYYRNKFDGQPNANEQVAAALVKVMDLIGVDCPCGRNMILNADTRADFMVRRDAYTA